MSEMWPEERIDRIAQSDGSGDHYAKRKLNPPTSSLTHSQARQMAVETGLCADGYPCGEPGHDGDDLYCAGCPNRRADKADPGAHYRREIRRRITDNDIARGWVSVKLDPYRICRVVGIAGGPHEHATKKLLRGEAKGHEARTVIRETRACLDRWEEMLDEDEEEARCR